MTRIWTVLAFALAMLLAVSAVGVGASPAATPVRVLVGRAADPPAVVVDSTGAKHIAAVISSDKGPEVWYATDRSGSWTRRLALPAHDYEGYVEPSISLDEDGRVHIAAWKWVDATGGCALSYGVYYVTDRGRTPGTFGTPVKVVPGDSLSVSLKTVGGIRYLAYANRGCRMTDDGWDPGPYRVYLRTDAGGPSTRTKVGVGDDPSLRIGDDTSVHIAYSAGSTIRYAIRPSGGAFTVTNVASGVEPSLALDGSDRPQVAYTKGGVIQWSAKGLSGWGTPERLGTGKGVFLSIDGEDVPHVATGGKNVVHYWRSGGTWSSKVVAAGVRTDGVAARASSGGLVIVWTQEETLGAWGRGVWVVTD
jgi:hypothetical protein